MFWITWSRGVLQVVTFATTLLVARILVPADYGVMALATFWTGTVGMLAEMGLGSSIIQFRDLDRREIDTCFWIVMSLATIGCAALVFSAPLIAGWFAVRRLADVLSERPDGFCEAFRLGSATGVQFHPEIDEAALEQWYGDWREVLEPAGVTESQARAADVRHLPGQAALAELIFGGFVTSLRA